MHNLATNQGQSWRLDKLRWQEINPDGTKYSLLEGRKDQPGESFSYAFFIPAGLLDPPHFHSATARIFVVSGELLLGYGEKTDRERLERYEAGSYLLVPANQPHFDGAEVDTLIIGVANGPWSTTYLEG